MYTGCVHVFSLGARKSEEEDTDNDGDKLEWNTDMVIEQYYESGCWRINENQRLLYEKSSWQRMLPVHTRRER